MIRQTTDAILADLSRRIGISAAARTGRHYERRNGYHTLDFDRLAALSQLNQHGPAVLDAFVSLIPKMSADLVRELCDGELGGLHFIRDTGWVLAYCEGLIVDIRLTTDRRELAVTVPGLVMMRNIDREPVTIQIHPLIGSMEDKGPLDLHNFDRVTLQPGDDLVIDGFSTLPVYERAGQLVLVLGSLPVAAYEFMYSLVTGNCVGVFSADAVISSATVVLRTMASAGWAGADDLAMPLLDSGLREARWAALNYAWQSDSQMLPSILDRLRDDPDTELRDMARQCVTALAPGAMGEAA